MNLKVFITKDERYISFGDGIVYEFHQANGESFAKCCTRCALWPSLNNQDGALKCSLAPCQSGLRYDKNAGFWRISQKLGYPNFV